LLAEAYFQLGNRILAFYHYDEVMDLYADGRFYAPSLQRQYDIAEAFLQGYKRRFLKLPILPADDEAIEMLFRIQTRSPGSPLAEKALLRTADYYYATRQYDLAADAYLAYANSYPRSPLVPQTKLRQAYSTQAQFRGTRFDATTLVDARQQLSELSVLQPQIAEEENLPNVIERIDAALARKLDQTADYYRRTKQPAASAYTLFVLQDSYPDSPEAQDIPVKLQKLPADAVERARAVYFESGPNPADSLEPLIPTGLNTNTPTQTPAPATRQENP
jgi:hypothetical protein